MIFQIFHLTYEVPEGIDIQVFEAVSYGSDMPVADFNFLQDGKVIAMYGKPSWEDVGIRAL